MIAYIKIEKSTIKFGGNEIEKQTFHQSKRPISIKNVDKIILIVVYKIK